MRTKKNSSPEKGKLKDSGPSHLEISMKKRRRKTITQERLQLGEKDKKITMKFINAMGKTANFESEPTINLEGTINNEKHILKVPMVS